MLSALVSRSRAMPVGGPRRENWPALQEGGAFALAGRGVVGAGFALPRDAGRRPALQEGAALALAGRSVVGAGFALPRDAGRRPRSRALASAPGEGGALALAGRSVVGAGFALPRDAGRRPALQEGAAFALGGAVLSALVSRSRAMPVGDRRSRRVALACCRRWFRVLSVLVSRSRAMPVGDRRSKNWPALQVPRSNLPCP